MSIDHLSRRRFVELVSVAGLGSFPLLALAEESRPAAAVSAPAGTAPAPAVLPGVPDEFPTQAPALAREMVGVSHVNIERVNELLKLHPTLANAAWDWGFGDWETALGAASHMGRRDIADALLASGARPSIFSAAMLGQLKVVTAFIEASPGIQGTPGPHGITLLAHATAGGDAAKPVVVYLQTVGGADPKPAAVALPDDAATRFGGVYAFGARDSDRIEIAVEGGSVRFKRAGGTQRFLIHLGDQAFHPAGAPNVRVRFAASRDAGVELTVSDPDVVLRARRIG
jgi:hypothetical protein